MRILHTADWHIGQTLAGFSREAEHRAFLDHLGTLIVSHDVDALLVAGDVFDGINPSGEAQRMLYTALATYLHLRPGLTIVMIAGNHDPAARLEAPEAVLRALGVHVVGTISTGPDGTDLAKHLIPLADATGVKAHVLAIPFLRAADLPGLTLGSATGPEGAVVAAVRTLHATLTEAAVAAAQGLPLIAMGHLTCIGAEPSQGAERPIRIGGEDAVPPSIYPAALSYIALGHLHKPQSLDGGRVRYSGSPFPLSASEIPYDHGVTLIELGQHDVVGETIIQPLSDKQETDSHGIGHPETGHQEMDNREIDHPEIGRTRNVDPGKGRPLSDQPETVQPKMDHPGIGPAEIGQPGSSQPGPIQPGSIQPGSLHMHLGQSAPGQSAPGQPVTGQSDTNQPTARQTLSGQMTITLTHRHIPLPRLVPNLRLPAKGAMALADLPALLASLSLNPATPRDLQPFAHVTLIADRPASQLKAEAEALLDQHPLRVASLIIDRAIAPLPATAPPSLSETTPEALFGQAFRQTHGQDPAAAHLAAFRDVLAEV